VQTNDLEHNSIVAFTRGADGQLDRVGEFRTGGRGGVERDVPLDSLASQDSLTYDRAHQLLFAVNAGSNTVTSFVVHGARLTRVQTVPSGGVFPVSVATGHNRLYVLNAGGSGNVTGYGISPAGRLDRLPHASRDLGLGNDSRPEFITAPADIAQAPDGDHVIVTTKANNTVDVFHVDRGGSLSTPVRNPAAAEVPFALSFDSTGRLVVANAGNSSVSTYVLRNNGTLETITAAVEDGQAALCWLVGTGNTFFGGNAGSSTISAFAVDAAGTASLTGTPDGVVAHTGGGSGGTIDLAVTADERFLYAENSFAGTVEGYRIHADHTLELVSTATGLPQFDGHGMEGLVAL
jgi:6-phosphogluconolactonase (cycloisomerase 2 family)